MSDCTAQTIAAQNDDFRLHPNKGTLCLTAGIRALGDLCVKEIISKVRGFNNFNADNDPYGEHDFGAFDYQSQKIFFKIDNYDTDFLYLSPDVTNHRNIGATQRYFNYNEKMLANAVENVRV